MRRRGCKVGLDDFLDIFNLVDKGEGLAARAMHILPKRIGIKYKRWVAGERMWQIRIENTNNCGGEAERALAKFGIKIYERRVRTKEHMFIIAEHQVRWAEYILSSRGIAFSGDYVFYDPKSATVSKKINEWNDRK